MSDFLKALEHWRHPSHPENSEEIAAVNDALSGVRAQVDVVLRETKELDLLLALAEMRLKARGWMADQNEPSR